MTDPKERAVFHLRSVGNAPTLKHQTAEIIEALEPDEQERVIIKSFPGGDLIELPVENKEPDKE